MKRATRAPSHEPLRDTTARPGEVRASPWIPVTHASDLQPCQLCGDPWCRKHKKHFSDCLCIGPHQDDEYEYKEVDGILYARRTLATRDHVRR